VAAPLTQTELDRLLDAPLSAPVSPLIQARDAALLGALASTGWRVSRIAALPRSAVNDPGVPLSNFARHWCGVYLGRRRDSEPALFVRHDRARGGSPLPLTTRSIERIVSRYGQRAGIVGSVTPERIRAAVRSAER
jgi:site-specific recombinase XerD